MLDEKTLDESWRLKLDEILLGDIVDYVLLECKHINIVERGSIILPSP